MKTGNDVQINEQPVIGLFKSTGVISKVIQWQTRCEYSHAATFIDDYCWEAWHVGGSRKFRAGVTAPQKGEHREDTIIDLYVFHEMLSPMEVNAMRTFLNSMMGAPYDFRSVLRFVTRRAAAVNGKLFCSELSALGFAQIHKHLLHGEPHNFSPRDLSISPLLFKAKTIDWRQWRAQQYEIDYMKVWQTAS